MNISMIWGLCFLMSVYRKAVATSTLTSTLNTDCACYGNDPTVDSIMPDCSPTSGLIAIDRVYRAAKLSSTNCPNTATALDRDEANCCTYNSTDDCQILVSYTDPIVADVYTGCNGVTSCSKQVTWQGTSSDCPAGYLGQTNYMCVEYYCFTTLDTATFCDTSGFSYTGSQLFVYNDNYPAAVSQSGCCACAVRSSSGTIDVNIIDFRLHDASSTCVQSLKIEDGGILTSYDCADNNDFNIQYLTTSITNTITVTLDNNVGTANGYMWIGLVALSGTLTMTCGSVAQCPGATTTSTPPSTSTTSTVTTTTPAPTTTTPTTTSAPTTSTTSETTTTTSTTTPTPTTTSTPTTTATPTTTSTPSSTTASTTSPPSTTTTSPTTTTPATTTTSITTASSSKDTLLFGLPVLQSLLILGGAVLLFLLLVGSAGCCIGYMFGNNKSYNLDDKSKTKPTETYKKTKPSREKDISDDYQDNKQNQRTISPPYLDPYSTSKMPMARVSMQEPRPRDLNGNTSFGYRQFSNPYITRNTNRRGSLPRVVL